MPKQHRDDINIGQDEWIEFVDVAARPYDRIVQIDEFITPLEPFWMALETNCIADCCGINAFSFCRDDIIRARATLNPQQLQGPLASLQRFIERSDADTFASTRLNQVFDKQVLLKLIRHLQEHLKNYEAPGGV